MKKISAKKGISRRKFLTVTGAGVCLSLLNPIFRMEEGAAAQSSQLFWVTDIHDQPFYAGGGGNSHIAIDLLLHLMGEQGHRFYRSSLENDLSGPSGMIEKTDVVLIKVNGQWKYRGCTNSDLIRGLIQKILEHPEGFDGEVVIFENGQGRGSLNCDTTAGYPDAEVHSNANDESHSFLYLVNTVFQDARVSAYLLDPIRSTFISATDHATDGYRIYENVSYPCFTTSGGNRVELKEGVWQGGVYSQNLKLINVPVLKFHDVGGSELTASLKHFYGIVSMADGQSGFRHYAGLGETCGKIVVSVRTPVLNIIDAIWVSHSSLSGYPASTTFRANQILASQDPVALDYWAAKHVLYPVSNSPRHLPDFPNVDLWLTGARDVINGRGGLYDPNSGILADFVTKDEEEMWTTAVKAQFTDVMDPAFWAYDYIYAIYARGITKGYGDGMYGPDEPVTRGQMAAFIIRAKYGNTFDYSAMPYFSDVPDSFWAFKYIQKMYEVGISTGYQDGTYMPGESVDRAQMAAFIVRSLHGETFGFQSTPHFADVDSLHWAFKYIQKMYEEGISTGYRDGTYRPFLSVNRSQMAAFLARAFLNMQ